MSSYAKLCQTVPSLYKANLRLAGVQPSFQLGSVRLETLIPGDLKACRHYHKPKACATCEFRKFIAPPRLAAKTAFRGSAPI
jgi:hypothetical protein